MLADLDIEHPETDEQEGHHDRGPNGDRVGSGRGIVIVIVPIPVDIGAAMRCIRYPELANVVAP